MWDKKLDLSSVTRGMNAVILVPDEDDSVYLMHALESAGISWVSGDRPTRFNYWHRFREETCYVICGSELSYSNRKLEESNAEGNGLEDKMFLFSRFPQEEIHPVSKEEISILLNN